ATARRREALFPVRRTRLRRNANRGFLSFLVALHTIEDGVGLSPVRDPGHRPDEVIKVRNRAHCDRVVDGLDHEPASLLDSEATPKLDGDGRLPAPCDLDHLLHDGCYFVVPDRKSVV